MYIIPDHPPNKVLTQDAEKHTHAYVLYFLMTDLMICTQDRATTELAEPHLLNWVCTEPLDYH